MFDPLILGLIGVTLMLAGFFLNLFKLIEAESKLYLTLNIIGAGLATVYSFLINTIPFIIFEGIWTSFAAYKFVTIFIFKK